MGSAVKPSNPHIRGRPFLLTGRQKLIAKAILSPSEADNFLISLTGTEPIMLCERVTLKSPQLYKREQLLYSDDEEQQAVPISEFCYLFEFWNREKLSLLSEIQNEFSADGRTRYEQTLELLEWAKCNCGIDFVLATTKFIIVPLRIAVLK